MINHLLYAADLLIFAPSTKGLQTSFIYNIKIEMLNLEYCCGGTESLERARSHFMVNAAYHTRSMRAVGYRVGITQCIHAFYSVKLNC